MQYIVSDETRALRVNTSSSMLEYKRTSERKPTSNHEWTRNYEQLRVKTNVLAATSERKGTSERRTRVNAGKALSFDKRDMQTLSPWGPR